MLKYLYYRKIRMNKNVGIYKDNNSNIYEKYLNEKIKPNYFSPEEVKKAQDYVDRIKKLNPDINFEKNVISSNGSKYRRSSTFSYDM
jgi:hypothetical protein